MSIRGQVDKRIFVFLIGVFLLSVLVSFAEEAETPKGIFYKANDFYAKAKYDDAIREYKKLLEKGLEDGNLYYNLGNAYFKKGELGEAIVNYERAKRLIPRDRDLEANYKHAGSLVKGKGAPFKKIWILRLLDNFFNSFTLNTMTIMISLLYLAIALTIIVGVVLRIPRMQKVLVLVILGGLFLVNAVFLRNRISLLNKEAIAIKEKADVRFGPFQRATTHFTLYEGTKVEVLSRKDEWAKVRRPDGKVGWVKSDTLEMI